MVDISVEELLKRAENIYRRGNPGREIRTHQKIPCQLHETLYPDSRRKTGVAD